MALRSGANIHLCDCGARTRATLAGDSPVADSASQNEFVLLSNLILWIMFHATLKSARIYIHI